MKQPEKNSDRESNPWRVCVHVLRGLELMGRWWSGWEAWTVMTEYKVWSDTFNGSLFERQPHEQQTRAQDSGKTHVN